MLIQPGMEPHLQLMRPLNSAMGALADLAIEKGLARRASREQEIYLELSQAMARLEEAQERRNLVNLIVEQAQENLDLMDELYKVGRASAVELTEPSTMRAWMAMTIQMMAIQKEYFARRRQSNGVTSREARSL